MPALYAGDGDFILLPSGVSKENIAGLLYYDIFSQKNLQPVYLNELKHIAGKIEKIIPWGWDYPLKTELLEAGLPQSLMPEEELLENIRRLSHRRTIIPFRKFLDSYLNLPSRNIPIELFSEKEVEDFLNTNPLSYFKAPWSSSGRGIVVSDHISRKGLLEWAHGMIRRQGSVMAEPAWKRKFDFASEWIIENHTPRFLGYSVFETSSRGKYHGNLRATQENLIKIISETVPEFTDNFITAQKEALARFIAPYYEGPLGIDMLADIDGNINPCVELNLRITMGHLILHFR